MQINLATNSGTVIYVAMGTTPVVPTTGTAVQGDEYRNTTPTETGTAGSKYVLRGVICTVGGTPGTWVPMRSLTGN